MPWQTTVLRRGEASFILTGEGFILRGRVWQGKMGEEAFWALRSLENPVHRARLLSAVGFTIPQRFGAFPNTGGDRRFLELRPATSAPVVLRFDDPIPTELVRDLRQLFPQGGSRAQVRHRSEVRPAEDHAPGAEGVGHDHDRQAADDRQDRRLQEVAPKPRKKTARKKKPTRRNARAANR